MKYFLEGRKAGVCFFLGGGGVEELVFGFFAGIFPLNETMMCVEFPFFSPFFWLAEVASAWIYLCT